MSVLRSCGLYNGEIIGIESIYNVIDGKQINIPEKIEFLRKLSQNHKLFCPCGCGANLTLVAGDQSLKAQHFRIQQDSSLKSCCYFSCETETSINSKIAIFCWLKRLFPSSEIKTRVKLPSGYEIAFYLKSEKIAVNYCNSRENISDDKLYSLNQDLADCHIIHITDISNSDCNEQYPEQMYKIQKLQGFCLYIRPSSNHEYQKNILASNIFMQMSSGAWQAFELSNGSLVKYSVSTNGQIAYDEQPLSDIAKHQISDLNAAKKLYSSKNTSDLASAFHGSNKTYPITPASKYTASVPTVQKTVTMEYIRKRLDDPNDNQPIFENGQQWVKCEICGKIDIESEFVIRNTKVGLCRECDRKGYRHSDKKPSTEPIPEFFIKCPECGGKLIEKNGRYGKFLGCSNFPNCRHTENIK